MFTRLIYPRSDIRIIRSSSIYCITFTIKKFHNSTDWSYSIVVFILLFFQCYCWLTISLYKNLQASSICSNRIDELTACCLRIKSLMHMQCAQPLHKYIYEYIYVFCVNIGSIRQPISKLICNCTRHNDTNTKISHIHAAQNTQDISTIMYIYDLCVCTFALHTCCEV